MARRTISVGNANDVMRVAQRQRCPGGLYYLGGRYDDSNPFSDAFVGDLYEAFRVLHIANRDQQIILAYGRNESIARIAEALRIPKSTCQAAKDATCRRILKWPPFGRYAVICEELGGDIRALMELFS